MTILDIKPYFADMEPTEQLLSSQTHSFNEAGQSFNEAGIEFGGIYGSEGRKPKIDSIKNL